MGASGARDGSKESSQCPGTGAWATARRINMPGPKRVARAECKWNQGDLLLNLNGVNSISAKTTLTYSRCSSNTRTTTIRTMDFTKRPVHIYKPITTRPPTELPRSTNPTAQIEKFNKDPSISQCFSETPAQQKRGARPHRTNNTYCNAGD